SSAGAGATGDVVTISLPTQRKDLADLLNKAKINVRPHAVTENSPEVKALIGEVAEFVKPVAPKTQPQQSRKPNTGSGQRRRPMRETGANPSRQSRPSGSRPNSRGSRNGNRQPQGSR
ncbi:MAG TPA: ATP-dependent helicase, partial [Microbacteriaceae bacterium]